MNFFAKINSFIKNHKRSFGFFIAALAFIGYLNGAFDFYKNHLVQKKAEDGLILLNTGVSIQHVKSVFGAPIAETHDRENKLSQYVYSFKRFYLQVVFNNDNTVVFFAVTTKDKNFKPKIPYLNDILGKNFSHYSPSFEFIESTLSSKFFEYSEFIYLGNPGNYRNLYLAYNPSGIMYHDFDLLPDTDKPTPEQLEAFRAQAFPNTYGVGEHLGDSKGPESNFGVGISYYTSVDLPEHRY